MSKTWLITGTSKGLGRAWAEAALLRGDRVAATARNLRDIEDLVEQYSEQIFPIRLDVTSSQDCFQAVNAAFEHFSGLDVIVNNAGYGLDGAVEEISEEEAPAIMDTNFFGALWITQAALPHLRKQGHGHILQVASLGGQVGFPGAGLYCASKWALEGMSEALSKEVRPFGIHVTIIEPGGFDTEWSKGSMHHARELPAYHQEREQRPVRSESVTAGDPRASAGALFAVVESETPPLRLLLGTFAVTMMPEVYAERLQEWKAWEEISLQAEGK